MRGSSLELLSKAISRRELPFFFENPSYSSDPSPEQLSHANEDMLRHWRGLLVSLKGSGHILFLDQVDLLSLSTLHRGMPLDHIVKIGNREVMVYHDRLDKPAIGEGLNVRSQITLEGCFPPNKDVSKISDSEKQKWEAKLLRNTLKMGASQFGFNWRTGEYTFVVEHFSRYALEVSEDEEEDDFSLISSEDEPAEFEDSSSICSDPHLEACPLIDEEPLVADATQPSLALDQKSAYLPPTIVQYTPPQGLDLDLVYERMYISERDTALNEQFSACSPTILSDAEEEFVQDIPLVRQSQVEPKKQCSFDSKGGVSLQSTPFSFVRGRSFRVGWGPGNRLVCPFVSASGESGLFWCVIIC